MDYLINKLDSVIHTEADAAKIIYSGNGMTVECFHLRKGTSLMESMEPDFNGTGEKRTICYVIMNGSVEYWLGDEKVILSGGESITIMPEGNFSAWALEDSVLFSFHNHVEPDIDNTPVEFVDAVKKVELKDAYLLGHNKRVGKYSMLIMQTICPENVNYSFYLSSAYHDVGKVVVPESVLNKPGKLTEEEFTEIQKHPVASFDILKEHLGSKTANYARWHHEKLDGTGYPDRIKGEQIPLESRIMAVADIFDALTTARCYRQPYSFEKALEIMQSDVDNGKIDGDVFDVLRKLVNEGKIVEGIDNQTEIAPDKVNL